ncbi:MAG: hypothetical protein NVSMB9_37270 [Isosphaeraceae bacterium]
MAQSVSTAPAPVQVGSQPAAPELRILEALRTHPATAPYRFVVRSTGQQFALSGRVGTKAVHDAAIRLVIDLGYPVRDDLTIDTRVVYRGQQGPLAYNPGAPGVIGPSRVYPYVYPPPLFGRLDEPFLGFEPPLVSYPPWWGAAAGREPLYGLPQNSIDPSNAVNPPVSSAPTTDPAATVNKVAAPTVEMSLDARGVAVLRGWVSSLADRATIGQTVAETPGITEVVNLLEVRLDSAASPGSDRPPPPPTPAIRPRSGNTRMPPPPRGSSPEPRAGQAPSQATTIRVDSDELTRRVGESFARRPALASAPISVTSRDGIVTLSGRLPSAYEAMLAFRAASQTPGVREVIDRIEFLIPDGDVKNPLSEKGRPEDVEPYLLSQIRRQVGDVAHVDQVRFQGDTLEIRGTVTRVEDVPRIEATLRSIPLLRGLRLEPTFVSE